MDINDIYRVIKSESIGEKLISSLFLMYQPIIGHRAISLYMTLLSDENVFLFQNHNRLSLITNMSINEIESERKRLEEVLLLKTFSRRIDNKEEYVYKLLNPLTINEFLKHDIFSVLLKKSLGIQEFQNILSSFYRDEKLNDFKEISAKIDYSADPFYNGVEFKKIEEVNLNNMMSNIDFDYEKLLRETTPLIFPIKARTSENLKTIGNIANLYGLSVDDMNFLIGKCSNFENESLDIELLKSMALSIKPKDKKINDKYELSPIVFLQNIQNGTEVTKVDARLLEYLSLKLNMKNDVINILVEYVLDISNNRLPRNLVEKIAGEWIRENINTKDKAKSKIQKENKSKTNMILPDYYSKITENTDLTISDEDIENLKMKLKGKS